MTQKSALIFSVILSSLLLSACGGSDTSDDQSNDAVDIINDSPIDNSAAKLVVNEIVASPADGEHDWIELYALEDIDDVSAYSIVDDNEAHELQALPEISLNAGDFLIIQAIDEDDTPPEDAHYVNFKLGGDDAVTLYLGSSIVSQLDWEDGDAPEGYSYGLYTDGTGSAQTMQPSAGEPNSELSDPIVELDTVTNNDAQLRINEIVAKDANDGYDWIELYASGDSVVFLGDYSLADESSERFSLPDVSIAPGEFYRVYASGEEIENLDTISFKLGSSDQVSLYFDSDLVDQISWSKGQALIGKSYGRFPDGSDAVHSLSPSPEAANTLTTRGPLVINEVVASQNDDSNDWFELYNNGQSDILLNNYQIIDSSDDIEPVTLPELSLAPGEYIVIQASDEDPGSYFVPFKLGKEDELSLMLNGEVVDYLDWQESDVSAGYSYGLSSDGSWQQNTLSTSPNSANSAVNIYVQDRVESIYFDIEESQWQHLLDNASDEEYHLASVSYKGVTLDEVGIRTKGNSSLQSVIRSGSERFSFNIDINEYVDGQKLLGMKKFVLNNMFNDPSYMREYIAYDLLEEMGVATPEHSFVNVYVNDELKGLYLLVEFVNGDFLEKNFSNAEGDLYKPDGTGSDLQYISDNMSSYSGVELKTNEETSDNGAFINFVNEMAYGDALSVIDYDSVLRYMSVSVALSNLDSYHGALAHNYYIYEQDGVFSFLPWDLNEAFGSFDRDCTRKDIRELYIDEPTDGPMAEKPMINHVFSNSEHLASYHAYLQQLIDGPLEKNAFAARIASIAALIDEHVENDPTAFYSYSQFIQNQTTTVSGLYGLTSFVEYRVDNMTKQLNGELPSSNNGFGFCN
ncbi:CotH kinase family protein [Glaciecola sp. MH2013]|uniref:CotH kinase family protein n=1 Tax=Glaciecola sp. MH2013 TaxID=2785524 RepID=UPI00189CC0EC|nr:CotH kinase family protein [Glaciecola sp. MH2013]MBF7074260.1 CotH kinase family protein [Glaciecola sp. MH2013]